MIRRYNSRDNQEWRRMRRALWRSTSFSLALNLLSIAKLTRRRFRAATFAGGRTHVAAVDGLTAAGDGSSVPDSDLA
jgi:hypothetical protein